MGNSARGVAAAATWVLLTACGGEGGLKLPTHGSVGGRMLASLTGKVVGDPATGCVWLELAVDRTRVAALWPPDYRVRFDPVRIYDARGRVVMREGTMHSFGGGHSGEVAHKVPRGCRAGVGAFHVNPLAPEAERAPL